MTDGLTRSSRADARDNRDRILEAARALFSAEGLAVPMREIARHAGVGPATLYRHFPTKESLVTEAFTEQMGKCGAIVEEALADPDPWHGFCTLVIRVFELHAQDRGRTAAFLSAYPKALALDNTRAGTLANAAELARRAKAAGKLRPDFVVQDLILIIMANSGVRATDPHEAAAASRRFAALAIDAFRADGAAAPLPPATWTPQLVS
ncbi:TetR/AcrR family transcriptional regulator [Amycolatopsis sacchari]|uniref:DNA-binding transcriptional regulator, AcrR family n=1 Tax=Amycolatopsis sacchari TaxID=115433 RepID=A0A1I3UJV8_9PSEU|nr:TetR/AcrR family transcriptional regulator [Amycolatopsis sacchari]SFJ83794.1 DNA-binding transcriptional regulator, AcrR family [Amycolatopsis sacchari]